MYNIIMMRSASIILILISVYLSNKMIYMYVCIYYNIIVIASNIQENIIHIIYIYNENYSANIKIRLRTLK